MVRCKAGEALRSEAYIKYAAVTKGEAERRRWPFIDSLLRGNDSSLPYGGKTQHCYRERSNLLVAQVGPVITLRISIPPPIRHSRD